MGCSSKIRLMTVGLMGLLPSFRNGALSSLKSLRRWASCCADQFLGMLSQSRGCKEIKQPKSGLPWSFAQRHSRMTCMLCFEQQESKQESKHEASATLLDSCVFHGMYNLQNVYIYILSVSSAKQKPAFWHVMRDRKCRQGAVITTACESHVSRITTAWWPYGHFCCFCTHWRPQNTTTIRFQKMLSWHNDSTIVRLQKCSIQTFVLTTLGGVHRAQYRPK